MRMSRTSFFAALVLTGACVGNSQAFTLSPEDCKRVCTASICDNKTMLARCQGDCSDFKVVTVCPKAVKAAQHEAGAVVAPPLPSKPTVIPKRPASAPAAPKEELAATPAAQGAFTLEVATKKLLQITKGDCATKIRTLKNRIEPDTTSALMSEPFLEKPRGYKQTYKTKDEFMAIIKQVEARSNAAEAKVLKDAKTPDDTPDKVFGGIYPHIDLEIRDNCQRMTTLMTKEIEDQNKSVKSYKKSLPGRAQKAIGKITDR